MITGISLHIGDYNPKLSNDSLLAVSVCIRRVDGVPKPLTPQSDTLVYQ